jgi:hypothetical protein
MLTLQSISQYKAAVLRLKNKVTLGMAIDIVKYRLNQARLTNNSPAQDIQLCQALDNSFSDHDLTLGIDKNRASDILSNAIGARSMNACVATLKASESDYIEATTNEALLTVQSKLEAYTIAIKYQINYEHTKQGVIDFFHQEEKTLSKPDFLLSTNIRDDIQITNVQLWDYIDYYLQQDTSFFKTDGCEEPEKQQDGGFYQWCKNIEFVIETGERISINMDYTSSDYGDDEESYSLQCWMPGDKFAKTSQVDEDVLIESDHKAFYKSLEIVMNELVRGHDVDTVTPSTIEYAPSQALINHIYND